MRDAIYLPCGGGGERCTPRRLGEEETSLRERGVPGSDDPVRSRVIARDRTSVSRRPILAEKKTDSPRLESSVTHSPTPAAPRSGTTRLDLPRRRSCTIPQSASCTRSFFLALSRRPSSTRAGGGGARVRALVSARWRTGAWWRRRWRRWTRRPPGAWSSSGRAGPCPPRNLAGGAARTSAGGSGSTAPTSPSRTRGTGTSACAARSTSSRATARCTCTRWTGSGSSSRSPT